MSTFNLEVEDSIQDQDWFRDQIAFWRPRVCPGLVFMRLVSIEETNSDGASRYATCWAYQGGAAATIGVSPTFYLQSQHEQEVTIVHELLHVTLFPMTATMADDDDKDKPRARQLARLANDAQEQVVEIVSRALVDLAYGEEN